MEDVLDPVLFRAEGSTILAEEDMKACDATAGRILQESVLWSDLTQRLIKPEWSSALKLSAALPSLLESLSFCSSGVESKSEGSVWEAEPEESVRHGTS